jgi:hypothetical protein
VYLFAACGNSSDTNCVGTSCFGSVDAKIFNDARVVPDAEQRDAATMIAGKVCVLLDPRVLDDCDTMHADGLTVGLDGVTTSTGSDGTFSIAYPTSNDLVWTVSGTSIVTSMMTFGPSLVLTAMPTAIYTSMHGTVATEMPGQGAVIGHVLKGTMAEAGATATASPAGAVATQYETAAHGSDWSGASTGSDGAFWIPQLGSGATSITVTVNAGGSGAAEDVPVGNQTITFVTIGVH